MIEIENPYTGEVFASVPSLGPTDADAVMQYASEASFGWAVTPPALRADLLRRASDLLEERKGEIESDLIAEGGKTPYEAAGELAKTVATFRYYAGLGGGLDGRSYRAARPQCRYETRREPIGPVVAITPWNVPLASPARKIAPALLAGNPIVVKPASLTPISTYHLVAALVDAGLPEGVLQTITGPGSATGSRLVGHQAVRAVSFTGSTEVGIGLHGQLADPLVKLQLELGGKNGAVVLHDADVERAARTIVEDAFRLTGQQCTATSRVIMDTRVSDALTSLILAYAKEIGPEANGDPAHRLGPLITASHRDSVHGFVERAIADGATLLLGGNQLDRGGYFYAPTILGSVTPSMEVAREEVFGPVLSIIEVDGGDEALKVLNDTKYGLSASVHTRSLEWAAVFTNATESGIVSVNGPTSGIELSSPFGGFGLSGTASKEHGPESLDFYTRVKLVSWTS
jgi:aldehyde dehydrogenase (NAD+)